jgi:hypothetical protein
MLNPVEQTRLCRTSEICLTGYDMGKLRRDSRLLAERHSAVPDQV